MLDRPGTAKVMAMATLQVASQVATLCRHPPVAQVSQHSVKPCLVAGTRNRCSKRLTRSSGAKRRILRRASEAETCQFVRGRQGLAVWAEPWPSSRGCDSPRQCPYLGARVGSELPGMYRYPSTRSQLSNVQLGHGVKLFRDCESHDRWRNHEP